MALSPEERKQIYEEEKQRLEANPPQEAPTTARLTLKRPIVWAACALIVVIGAAIFAFHEYRLHEINQALGAAIGKDQGLTETILKVESDSSKITFAELFELCNKSVEGRTNLIVELRGLHPEMDYELKERLIAYLNAENDFVRAKREFYSKVMQGSSATNMYLEHIRNPPSSIYGWEFFNDQVRQLRQKVLEAASETD